MKTKACLIGLLFFIGTGSGLAQTSGDSLRQVYAALFERLKPDLQHTGLKLRFDAGLQFPVSKALRVDEAKILPGFGFNLGIGYGLTDYFSVHAGFISLSHSNEQVKVITSRQAGFDGFHAEVRYKLNPYGKNQYYLELGGGVYELVDQVSDGFSGKGFSLVAGFDRFITRELTMGFGLHYRLTRFDQRIRSGNATQVERAIEADMLMLTAIFIYTFPGDKELTQ